MIADHYVEPLYEWRSAPLVIVESGKESSSTAESRPIRSFRNRDMTPQLDFRHRVAFQLAAIPEVEAVFTSDYGKVFFVWTIVRERGQELYRRIYDKERELIEANEPIQFDFTIIASQGRDSRGIVTDPSARLAYSRH